ncbi:protein FAM169B isoform X1 [Periophthalmus magnuspinnatus]|uniref:protein FAM169B isoform X1 n=1 Tax=Periophthalmus magnuspinnatus TaxID=409849 RepID=UPI0024369ABC|nr:protein FAM169B isoform X1 [Periophthalmus magnuspinnatus]XP_033824030.2 protein FAM169B isoform X1 [Periophthalmus magnuspinnatus]
MLIHFNAGGTDRERAKFQVQAMYPVDLPLVGASELTSASLQYLSALESEPAQRDWFHLPTKSKVAITAANIKQLHLFNDKPECILLTLHLPDEPQQVVALYLCGNWWHIDDVLRTSKKSRNGLEAVKCTIERVLVLVLSQLVDRVLAEEQLFSNHPPTENCKLLWIHGEAVAFYSFKQKGSLCENCISRCYELPVLDTIYVRGHCRRRGFGLLMLQDFCDMFPDESVLGVSSPLSAGMMAVCKKFLIQHKEHRDVLYEVEAPSSWIQRRNIWLNIQIGRYSRSKSSSSSVEVEKDEGTDQL